MPNPSFAAGADRNQTLVSCLIYRMHSVLCDFIVSPNIVVSIHHDIRARIRGYWATAEQFLTSFYGNTFKRDWSFHILRFLRYRDNNARTDRKSDNCDWLWEMRTIFGTLNDTYENFIILRSIGCWQNNFKIQRRFVSASRRTIQRKGSVRWRGGEGLTCIKQISTQNIHSLKFT
jgi:hypothetical protein